MLIRSSERFRAAVAETISVAADEGLLTPQQESTLYGCNHSGDSTGALLGLARLIRRYGAEKEEEA